jgi:outer membrane protein
VPGGFAAGTASNQDIINKTNNHNKKMKKIILCAICAICGFTAANAQAKFGHVNTQEIIQAMPEYTKAKGEIDALQAQYEADLKSMNEELQKKGEAFDKEQATLPDNVKQRRQTELQEIYQKIQQSYQDNQQALAKASQEKMQAITTKVLDAIKAVGQAGGYVYIMEMGAGIPYISTTLSTDVTAQVKQKLGVK